MEIRLREENWLTAVGIWTELRALGEESAVAGTETCVARKEIK